MFSSESVVITEKQQQKEMHPLFTLKKRDRKNEVTIKRHSLYYVKLCDEINCGHLVIHISHEHLTAGGFVFFTVIFR